MMYFKIFVNKSEHSAMAFNESTSIFYDGDVGPTLLNAASKYTDSQAEHIKNRAPHNTGHVGSSTRVMVHRGTARRREDDKLEQFIRPPR